MVVCAIGAGVIAGREGTGLGIFAGSGEGEALRLPVVGVQAPGLVGWELGCGACKSGQFGVGARVFGKCEGIGHSLGLLSDDGVDGPVGEQDVEGFAVGRGDAHRVKRVWDTSVMGTVLGLVKVKSGGYGVARGNLVRD